LHTVSLRELVLLSSLEPVSLSVSFLL